MVAYKKRQDKQVQLLSG